MEQKQLKELLDKYASGKCEPEETALIESWYLRLNEDKRVDLTEESLLEAQNKLWAEIQVKTQPKIQRIWPRIAAAASVLLFLSIGAYFVFHKPTSINPILVQNPLNDVKPGRNQATLTLANGQKIILTQGLNGRLARQGNTLIQVNGAKAIVYTNDIAKSAGIEFNTLSTNKGEQSPYPLVLADGTKVWLNAASSITFPTAFTGDERRVTVTGEAYFEVTHNKALPFRVVAGGQITEDLGTHFDINAYEDEVTAKTTLLEGSVKVSNAKTGQEVYLKPGQESRLKNGHLKVAMADTEGAIAWRNGMFHFANADLPSLMRQFSRWYDVEIIYNVNRLDDEFTGDIPRNISLQQALKIIQLSGVQFKIEGRKMTITQ